MTRYNEENLLDQANKYYQLLPQTHPDCHTPQKQFENQLCPTLGDDKINFGTIANTCIKKQDTQMNDNVFQMFIHRKDS